MKSINKIRQMKWFGTPAKTDLKYLKKRNKKTSMSTKDKLVKNDEKNLNGNNLNWDSATEMAKDKKTLEKLL